MNNPEIPQSRSAIPAITAETLAFLKSRYSQEKGTRPAEWGAKLAETQARIIETNPHMVEFIELQAGEYPEALHLPIFETVVSVLTLIEYQTEADAMNEAFLDDKPET
ncbi:hypothetical protein F4X86_04540 [Candidatus Saccharibacteria bacterium]|nr:hypothetical protein [Candidatus Saccharibacteria bacterium]